jgi:uncharacterized membrane protein YgcG
VRLRFGGLAVVPFILALAMLVAPSVSADSYTDELVGRFDAQTHVVADAAARPPLRDPGKLNEQILTSRWTWSPGPPIWVAAVAASQTGVTTADAIHNVILSRNPEFSGVILVIDSKGYHVRAYNVPKVIADSVDPFMAQSANDHRNDPYGATSEFVGKLSGVDVASHGPVTTSPVVHAKHNSWGWVWVMLILVGVVLAVVGLIWFAGNRNRKRRKDAAAREQVKEQLIAAESDVGDLDSAVVTDSGADVSAESLKANSSLYEARKAYEAGDYTAARAHLRTVRSTVAKANMKLNPQLQRDLDSVTSVPDEDRRQATVRTQNPDTGQYVTINNNNYTTTQQPGYPHYYGGGFYNGVFFYPGYYPYAFWGPGWGWALADVVVMDALLGDYWGGGGYERGFEAGRDSAWADTSSYSGQSAGYDSPQADVGFGGNYQDSSSGDIGFGGNDSYSGGGDVGFGGSDFGGSDFGGGGSDSGGGDFGF